jgi:NADH:ubiquinone oxidoreductase subunit 5 (subunit L)/multisubunit Na+/H+ antiporter MnhA subunit
MLFYQGYSSQELYEIKFFEVLALPSTSIFFEAKLDKLSTIFLCMITLVSLLLSICSINSKTINPNRIGGMLASSSFFMSVLVISNNFFQMFAAMEAIGLCSYFFINIRYSDKTLYKASFKKIIYYQLSFVFFLIGIVTIYSVADTFDFSKIFALLNSENLNSTIEIFGINIKSIGFICVMLLIGLFGETMQFLFNTWPSDVVKNSSIVVALMQSFTIISSCVIILAKLIPLFKHSSISLDFCAIVGGITIAFIILAWLIYFYSPELLAKLQKKFGFIYSVFPNKYYVFIKKFKNISNALPTISKLEYIKTSCSYYFTNNFAKINGYIERNTVYSYIAISLVLMILLFGVYIVVYIL